MSSEVRRRIWNGKIPVRVTVNEPDSIGTQEYLIAANRISYLWLHLAPALAYFAAYLDESDGKEWWFEYNSEPVAFNRPVGLLHDILVGEPSAEPWELVLKGGKNFPETILKFNDADSTLYAYWLNQMKESCYIRDGNARAVMSQSVSDQETLWKAIADTTNPKADTSESFWGIASSLFKPHNSVSMEQCPVRFYPKNSQHGIQITVSALDTLADAISKLQLREEEEVRIILHGVHLSDTIKIAQLHPLGTYPDGFLHIVLDNGKA